MIPKWTLPAIDGARVATDSLVRNTILAGAEVDILCLPQASEQTDPAEMKRLWNVGNVFIIPRHLPATGGNKKLYYLKMFLLKPLTPLTFSSFTEKKLKAKTQKIIDQGNYDLVLLDGLHLGMSLLDSGKMRTGKNRLKIIYRAHNIEVDLWKKSYREKKFPIVKCALYLQSLLVEKYERVIIEESQGIAAIAQEDLDIIKELASVKSELIPLGLNFDSPLDQCSESEVKFLFIGRLDWAPNRDGLEWLLKEVWPTVVQKRPNARLKIVGSGNREWLKSYVSLQGLEILGFVSSIRDAYADCHFTIVPITYGSGTRIKVIESFSLGRRLISTKMGVQGADLGAHDYLHAESREEWIQILSTVELDQIQKEQLELSRKQVGEKFDEKKIGMKFYSWLKTFS